MPCPACKKNKQIRIDRKYGMIYKILKISAVLTFSNAAF